MKCNRLALCAYCLLLALPLGAQVNVRYEKKEKGVYEFIGENNLNIPVSVFVRFTDLQGFTGYLPSGRPYVLNSGSKPLFRLTPGKEATTMSSATTIRGAKGISRKSLTRRSSTCHRCVRVKRWWYNEA